MRRMTRLGLALWGIVLIASPCVVSAQAEQEYGSSTIVLRSTAKDRFEYVADVRWGAASAPKTLWLQGVSGRYLSDLADDMFLHVFPAFADQVSAGELNVRVSFPWFPDIVAMATTCFPQDREKWQFLSQVYHNPQFQRFRHQYSEPVGQDFLIEKLRSSGLDAAVPCFLTAQKHFDSKVTPRDPWPRGYSSTSRVNPDKRPWGFPRIHIGTLLDEQRFCGVDLRTKRPPTVEEIQSFVRERLQVDDLPCKQP